MIAEALTDYSLTVYQPEVDRYVAKFSKFQEKYPYLKRFLGRSGRIDHLALKASDEADFNHFIASLKAHASRISITYLNNRQLAIAQLIEPLQFDAYRQVSTLEVIQPKPGSEGQFAGVEHVEIYTPPLIRIGNTLTMLGIPYSEATNGYHHTLVFNLDPEQPNGREVKLTDRPILGVVALQRRDGTTTDIWPR